MIAALVLVSVTVLAQAKVEVGLKGGLNMSSISSDQKAVDFSNKTGYHFGAYGLIKVLSFGIQPEILYSTKGADVSAQNAADFSQDFTYVDIPIMFKLYTVAGLNVQAGPQFGMLVSAGGKDDNGDKIDKSDFKDSDISAAFGLGWDAPFGLSLTARYVMGLSDINPNGDSKNRTFQLSVGYKLFGLGK